MRNEKIRITTLQIASIKIFLKKCYNMNTYDDNFELELNFTKNTSMINFKHYEISNPKARLLFHLPPLSFGTSFARTCRSPPFLPIVSFACCQ